MEFGDAVQAAEVVLAFLALVFFVFIEWPRLKERWRDTRSLAEKTLGRIVALAMSLLSMLSLVLLILVPITKSPSIISCFLITFSIVSMVFGIVALRVTHIGTTDRWRLVTTRLLGVVILLMGMAIFMGGLLELLSI